MLMCDYNLGILPLSLLSRYYVHAYIDAEVSV
jgi:hypothetical protein